jgi:large subunit ribosomal protein L31
MKDKIHPKYYPNAKVTCGCGNTFTVGSTTQEIRVEICSKCHPFYTGKQSLIDTAGRVERFASRRAKAGAVKPVVKKTRVAKNKR